MTKKHFVPTIASITICSLALCNCSTISNYRKDPSEWNTPSAGKPKVEKAVKESADKNKSGGFFSFLKSKDKDKDKEITKPATAFTSNPSTSTPTLSRVSTPSAPKPLYFKQQRVDNYSTLPTENVSKKTLTGLRKERRKVGGLLHPDVDKLPTKKDLIEVQSVIPTSGDSNGLKIPIKP